jgi:hypothetical protein
MCERFKKDFAERVFQLISKEEELERLLKEVIYFVNSEAVDSYYYGQSSKKISIAKCSMCKNRHLSHKLKKCSMCVSNICNDCTIKVNIRHCVKCKKYLCPRCVQTCSTCNKNVACQFLLVSKVCHYCVHF